MGHRSYCNDLRRCGQLATATAELRERVHAAEAAARSSEEAAAAQRERLATWVDRQERTARRHAEVYQRLRSAYAVDRGTVRNILLPKQCIVINSASSNP